MEYGPSGPTAVKDINAAGTGYSDAAAAFIAANASPFTNPRDMPCAPKVPDPRNTQNTQTMFIWGHFDIPVTTLNNSGEQIICTSADPLAPVPIKWAKVATETNAVYDPAWCSPNTLARDYEQAGLSDMIYKLRKLGCESRSYRIVGHGLKVWVSKSTTLSRGNIEAGQFDPASSTNTLPYPTGWGLPGSTGRGDSTYNQWQSTYDPTHGFQACALTCNAIQRLRTCIETSKEQELGFLAADEGATVRWTDNNDYAFVPTNDRGVTMCHNQGFAQNVAPSYGTFQPVKWNTTAGGFYYVPSAMEQILYNPTFNDNGQITTDWVTTSPTGTQCGTFQDINRLGTFVKRSNQNALAYPLKFTANQTINQYYFTANLQDVGSSSVTTYMTNSDSQFNRGLYCDVSGVDPSQILTVQVCWHVEYIPRAIEPWAGEASPVDMRFEEIAAMVRNRLAFPIVVKGHSFFSSLKNALSKAAGAVGKIFATAAPVAQGILSSIPDPRAQAASMGLTAVMGIQQSLKRPRDE